MSFIDKYFLEPIVNNLHYNWFNTFFYVALALVIYFVLIKRIVKEYVKLITPKFVIATSLFVMSGTVLRIMEENYSSLNLFEVSSSPLSFGFYTVTPGIYFLMAIVILGSIIVSYYLSRYLKKDFYNVHLTISLIVFAPLFLYSLVHMTYILHFIVFVIIILAITLILSAILKKYLTINSGFALGAQITDGFATFSALTFFSHFAEKHVVSSILINNFGPISFLIVKIVLTLVIIYVIEKSSISEWNKNYVYLFLTIFGFATGFRDLLSIGLYIG